MELGDKSSEQLMRLLTVAGPLYTTSLAICYDVGFFMGVDIGFFTFYSITEHLVFALQALPWALVPALSIFSLIYIIVWGYHRNKKVVADFIEKFKGYSAEQQQQEIGKLDKTIKKNKIITIVVWISCVVAIVGCIRTDNYTTAFLVAVSQTVSQFVFHKDRLDLLLVRAALVLVLIATGWIASFLLGYERATVVLKDDKPREVIHSDAGDEKSRIIRSGEKGLLFKSF